MWNSLFYFFKYACSPHIWRTCSWILSNQVPKIVLVIEFLIQKIIMCFIHFQVRIKWQKTETKYIGLSWWLMINGELSGALCTKHLTQLNLPFTLYFEFNDQFFGANPIHQLFSTFWLQQQKTWYKPQISLRPRAT